MNAPASTRIVPAACPHDCPDTCAMRVHTQAGRIIRVEGDPLHPHTHGSLCTKVSRYAERTYHPDRLLTPLRRIGPKGKATARFEPCSWEEALSEIATRLKSVAAKDPQAIVPYSYSGTLGLIQGEAMASRFFNRLGASRLDRTICASAGAAALTATYGHRVGMHVEDFAHSRLIVIWGSNPVTSTVHFWRLAQEAKRKGAKLICIDPRRSDTAQKCHEHLAILPGTDGALALGVMHELIVNDWLDHDYLQHHVSGWEALREKALAWNPQRVAQICDISPDAVCSLARDWGLTRSAAIRLNYGMQRVRGGGNAVRLVALLPCLTGAWKHRGGGLLLSSSGWSAPWVRSQALERPDLLNGREPRTLNMTTIGDDLCRESSPLFGPRIDAIIVYNSNPVAVAPHSAQVVAGFSRSDLLTVVLEHFMTDTAELADYVLPATTQMEHLDIHKSYGHTDVVFNEPAIEPLGQCRPNTQIFRDLARHMGFEDTCFSETDEQMAAAAFDPQAVDFARLRQVGWQRLPVPDLPFAQGGFPTPSGRAQADAPGLGVPDYIPNYECAQSTPQRYARFPLAMISPPARNFMNSTFVNVPSLQRMEVTPLVEVHPDDAQHRGIRDGEVVEVFNDRGVYRCVARVSDAARVGVVVGLGVWWRKLGLAGTNVNELTHQGLTDLGQAASFYDCLVDLRRAAPL